MTDTPKPKMTGKDIAFIVAGAVTAAIITLGILGIGGAIGGGIIGLGAALGSIIATIITHHIVSKTNTYDTSGLDAGMLCPLAPAQEMRDISTAFMPMPTPETV